MAEERLLSVNVECYAGHRGEQTPRTLILGDRRIAVTEVLDAWLAPEYRYFRLKGADGDTYLVRHDDRAHHVGVEGMRRQRQQARLLRGEDLGRPCGRGARSYSNATTLKISR
jgi:hypothetical protein